ncbi:MAG: ABC transporter ATP-binding protein [Candidatus Bathyarchaeia archaeon]|jgi:putative ABC transport system ATP-binding protein
MQNSKPLIELRNVSKSYGSNEILKNINLVIREGEFVAVRGKSGAGKTNLFKIIGLIEPPTSGVVSIFGRDVSKLGGDRAADLRLRRMGLVFQFFNLLPSLSVMENVELPMALAGVKRAQRRMRALELLGYFGLEAFAERAPLSLSGGERQRVAIVRALVNRPRLLLADEPTSSLDDENALLVINMLKKINREEGVTVFLTTTDLYEPLPAASVECGLQNGELRWHVGAEAKVIEY